MTIDFDAPPSGASASLSAASAVTDTSGRASVAATADSTGGMYAVTASAAGVTSSASFNLTNLIQPLFSGLSDQTITYGTASVDVAGTLAAGSQVPTGDTIAITLDGVTQDAVIGSDGSFATTFTTATLHASSTAYAVTYAFAAQNPFFAADGSSQLTVTPASLTITAVSESMRYGGVVPPLIATYSGFVNGDTPAGLATPVVLDTSATSDSPTGVYPITASGASSPDYTIGYVNGTLTIAAPVTPATPRARAANGFVTTLYEEVLGRGAESPGLRYWTREYLGRTPPSVIWLLFARSPERLGLEKEGRSPTIPLCVAYSDAVRNSRRASHRPTVVADDTLHLRHSGLTQSTASG